MRQLVVYTDRLQRQPAAEALSFLAQAGATLAEISGLAPATHIDLADETAVAALADALTDLPIQAYSLHAPTIQPSKATWDISQVDEDKRQLAVQGNINILRAGAMLGVHHIVIHPGVDSSSPEQLANSRASLQQLAEVAQDWGLQIAVENLPLGYLGDSLPQMQQLLEGLNPDIVGLCLDTGHANLGPHTPADYIRAFPHHLIAIHWQDNHGTKDEHLFPGVGSMVWEDFFAALNEVGYDLPVTLEAFL